MIDMFTMDTHTRCWKKYEVRPDNGASNPTITKSEFCVFDLPNSQYLYSTSWVDFLIEKLSSPIEYDSLYLRILEDSPIVEADLIS